MCGERGRRHEGIFVHGCGLGKRQMAKKNVANTMHHQNVGTPTVALHKVSTLHFHLAPQAAESPSPAPVLSAYVAGVLIAALHNHLIKGEPSAETYEHTSKEVSMKDVSLVCWWRGS
jgi:hypothetical protein